MRFRSVTSASGEPKPLASTADPTIVRINRIGLATLAECMQTVYEDGPKRATGGFGSGTFTWNRWPIRIRSGITA